ncbi:MAG: hypothetical protein NDI61_12265, partial [Bdellovibrionaceae bacterium]|nr:hypothetical protein [Pseudobdellovibrionaceae bacterium]
MSQRPYGSFNSGTDSGPVRVHIKDEVFVSLYSPSLSRGCAAVIRTAQLNPPTIKMVFADVHTIFGADAPKDLQLKLVGPRASETQMLDLLKAYDLKVQGSVWREHLGTDVVFYPETGRLRVAKEDSSTPAQTPPAAHAGTARKMRVLIVDDSPTIHKLLTSIFSSDPEIEIVGHVQ